MNPIKYFLVTLFLFHSSISTALTTITIKYYPVNGSTTKELHDAITIHSPIGTAGLTQFSTEDYDFEIIRNDDGEFRFSSATISQDIVIILPKWTNRSGANNCVTEQWDNAMSALKKHEENHSAKYQELESRLNTSALKLPSEGSKVELYNKVQHLLHEIFKEIQEEQHLYDKSTNFGQTEGVSLSSC